MSEIDPIELLVLWWRAERDWLTDSSGGLSLTAPNFITFQTGTSSTQSNSIVINSAGDVSVTGRANLNGAVGIGKNFADTSTHNSVKSILDVTGTTHLTTSVSSYSDNPRLKLVSSAINPLANLPSLSQSTNEISGVNTSENSGFLRLSAQNAAKSCIELIGDNTSGVSSSYSNSIRFNTANSERMIIDGSGNVGVGTGTPGVRLDVVSGMARVNSGAQTNTALTTTGRVGINQATPTVPLDVSGAARISGNLDLSNNGRIIQLVDPSNNQDAATKRYVDNSIPIGGIIMWSGTTGTSLPSNWKLCDGSTYNGIKTPDLRGRFVLSSGQGTVAGMTNRTIDSSGGSETVALTEAQMPSHKHDVTARIGTTSGQATDGGHSHSISAAQGQTTSGTVASNISYAFSSGASTIIDSYHALTAVNDTNSYHTHTITVSETSKGSGSAHENMPPFYVLAFIMRVS